MAQVYLVPDSQSQSEYTKSGLATDVRGYIVYTSMNLVKSRHPAYRSSTLGPMGYISVSVRVRALFYIAGY